MRQSGIRPGCRISLLRDIIVVTRMIIAVNQSSDIVFRIQAFATNYVIWYDAGVPVVLDSSSCDSQQSRYFLVIKETYSTNHYVMALSECCKRVESQSGFFSRRDYARMIFIDNLVSHWQFVLQEHRIVQDKP